MVIGWQAQNQQVHAVGEILNEGVLQLLQVDED